MTKRLIDPYYEEGITRKIGESMEDFYKIFIVEDDPAMAEGLTKLLSKWRYRAIICEDFENVLAEFQRANPHIVVMDVNIPVFDGFYWCKKIREVSSVPILFVSSRDSNMDIIMAINNGGDDYIQKPFDSHVLIAKIQAAIRRTYEYRPAEQQVLEYKNVILNLADTTVYYHGQNAELTRNEFKVLKILMENSGKIVGRDDLMKQLWNDDIYVNENTLTVNINRLRKKLEELGVTEFISTKKGMGYTVQ